MYSSPVVLLHIGVIRIPLILSSHHHCPILTEYQSHGLICLSSLTRKSYQGDDYQVGRISYHSEVSLLVHVHPLNANCRHLGLPFQGANNVVHVRAIGGGASKRSCGHELLCRQPVSIPSHIQGEVNVIHKLDYMPLAYCGFL